MKNIHFALPLSILFTLSAAAAETAPAAPDPAVEELRRLNADYVASFLKSDAKRYDELLAPDFRCIAPGGQYVDRAEFLKSASEPADMESFTAEDVAIQVIGDVAVIQARTPYTRRDGRTGESRYTDIWVLRDGRWQTLSAQITPVRK
jgi:ketosteroid isomerase-like protein